jgi:hypothetical protein
MIDEGQTKSPPPMVIDEPNFSGSVGTAYTREGIVGSDFILPYYNIGQGGMASASGRFRPFMRDALYVPCPFP